MSFLFDAVAIPIWFLLLLLGSSAPLWINWYKKFHRKFIKTGLLKKRLDEAKTSAEVKVEILKKATENWNPTNNYPGAKNTSTKKILDSTKKPHTKNILKVLADHGERGMLLQSISDKLDISSIETDHSITYLIEHLFIEAVNAPQGTVYHLTTLGKSYCIKKGFISS